MNKIKDVVIVGGGTAGWMTAASLSSLLGGNFNLTLVESDEIGTVGVGESTIPALRVLNQLLKIDEQQFLKAVQGTFKLGISFENWKNIDEHYFHSFGWTGKDCWAGGFQHFWLKGKELGINYDYGDYCPELMAAMSNKFELNQAPTNQHNTYANLNYAYHIDASRFAKALRSLAESKGCKRIEGQVIEITQNSNNGYIESISLDNNQTIHGDFFVDCTGFKSLLVDKRLGSKFEDWSHWLPCDSAYAVQSESTQAAVPYTRAIAHESGWQWRIPLQNRVGNGIVYSSAYQNDDNALDVLLNSIDGKAIIEPNKLKFKAGQRRQQWSKNCVSIGLSAGFIEPLEATSIHLIQQAIIRLMQMFPTAGINQADINEFNIQMNDEFEYIRDFIILHYHVTNRNDSEFWRYCRDMSIPDSLQHRIDLFRETGRVFQIPGDLFAENSWVQVMLGQGITPKQYHPIANMMSNQELTQFLQNIRRSTQQQVTQLSRHQQFVERFCNI